MEFIFNVVGKAVLLRYDFDGYCRIWNVPTNVNIIYQHQYHSVRHSVISAKSNYYVNQQNVCNFKGTVKHKKFILCICMLFESILVLLSFFIICCHNFRKYLHNQGKRKGLCVREVNKIRTHSHSHLRSIYISVRYSTYW